MASDPRREDENRYHVEIKMGEMSISCLSSDFKDMGKLEAWRCITCIAEAGYSACLQVLRKGLEDAFTGLSKARAEERAKTIVLSKVMEDSPCIMETEAGRLRIMTRKAASCKNTPYRTSVDFFTSKGYMKTGGCLALVIKLCSEASCRACAGIINDSRRGADFVTHEYLQETINSEGLKIEDAELALSKAILESSGYTWNGYLKGKSEAPPLNLDMSFDIPPESAEALEDAPTEADWDESEDDEGSFPLEDDLLIESIIAGTPSFEAREKPKGRPCRPATTEFADPGVLMPISDKWRADANFMGKRIFAYLESLRPDSMRPRVLEATDAAMPPWTMCGS
jgi:hypothetical protein